jgi:hypothetical protein
MTIPKSIGVLGAFGLCLACSMYADNNFYYVGPNGQVSPNGLVYTSPYEAQIDGGPTVFVVCDDYVDEANPGSAWPAAETDLSLFVGGNSVLSSGPTTLNGTKDVYYTSGYNASGGAALTQTQAYITAAILSVDILSTPPADDIDYSYALWGLFDGGIGSGKPLNVDPAAVAVLETAETQASAYATGSAYETALGHGVTIYSPTGDGTNGAQPQEFIGVPEPANWAVLGFDFVGAGIVGLYFRRRNSRIR